MQVNSENKKGNVMLNTLSSHPNRLNSSTTPDLRSVIAIVFAVWFALAVWLAARNIFGGPPGSPPILLLFAVVIPIAVFLFAFWTWHSFHDFVLEADVRLLVATQAWRFAGFGFLGFYAQGLLPGYFAWPAALGDMAIALTAPWLVIALFRCPGFVSSRTFIAWNVFGILDFAVAVGMGAMAPLLFPDLAGTVTLQMATAAPMRHLPLVLIPTFAVPMFTIFHLVALFQARRFSSKEVPR
jgi:hypothetical protein